MAFINLLKIHIKGAEFDILTFNNIIDY